MTVAIPSLLDRFRHNIRTCDADGPVSLLQTRLNTTTLPRALQRAPMLTLSRRDAPPEARTKTRRYAGVAAFAPGWCSWLQCDWSAALANGPRRLSKTSTVCTYEVHPYLFETCPGGEGNSLVGEVLHQSWKRDPTARARVAAQGAHSPTLATFRLPLLSLRHTVPNVV